MAYKEDQPKPGQCLFTGACRTKCQCCDITPPDLTKQIMTTINKDIIENTVARMLAAVKPGENQPGLTMVAVAQLVAKVALAMPEPRVFVEEAFAAVTDALEEGPGFPMSDLFDNIHFNEEPMPKLSYTQNSVSLNLGEQQVAFFGRVRIDFHTPGVGSETSTSPEGTTLDDWHRFKEATLHHYGVQIPDDATPHRLR